jgi:hypothetical protein
VNARRAVTVLVVLGVVAGFGYWLGSRWLGDGGPPLPDFGPDCTARADGSVALDHDQMSNAATVTAVGARLGMPDRAVVVALATALQESKLRNLPHLGANNDHDSIGLFQQRPSQGWGTVDELGDPRIAAERFYRALAQVPGWEQLRITEAAQRVQRSAYPEAYEDHRDRATVLAKALLGRAIGAVSCTVPDDPAAAGPEAAGALGRLLARDWGDGVSVAIADPPGLTVSAGDQDTGWRYAHWLVARAAEHGVIRVHFADLEWTAAGSGWSEAGSTIDHVHAEVAA